MGFPLLCKDRLGMRHPRAANPWARNSAYTTIPADESILLFNWLDLSSPPYTGDPALGLWLFSDNPTIDFLYLNAAEVAGKVYWTAIHAGGSHNRDLGAITGEHFFVGILDRDNGNLEMWIDSVKADTIPLTHDPDFTTACQISLFGGSAYEQTCWKASAMSLANGATPTQAELASILKYMSNPDAPLHPQLLAALGSVYSLYYPGEGNATSTSITDDGLEGKNLTIQAGQTVASGRVKKHIPYAKPSYTYFGLQDGYTATTGNVDFGFSAIEPVEFRALLGPIGPTNHTAVEIRNQAGTHYIKVERASGTARVSIRAGGVVQNYNLTDDEIANPKDLAIACIASNAYICISGQRIAQLAMGATLNLSGNCQVNLNGASQCCYVEAHNTFTTFGDFCELICCSATMDPERIMPNLETTPRIRLPIHSGLVAAGDNTLANQGTGGGTLTLSAVRSTSCIQQIRALQ